MTNKSYTAKDIKILTDQEHVRKRLNVYLGNTNLTTYNVPMLTGSELEVKQFTFVPAAYRAVEEIIGNAIDEFTHINQRTKTLSITADPTIGKFTISDNGRGVPIEKHSSGKYTPEVVFGSMRSGRNFDDNDRTSGIIGVNGVGSSCVCYTSSEFEVTIHRDGKKYYQKFVDGAGKVSTPKITAVTGEKTGTEISFQLDPDVFKHIELPEDLFKQRAIEIAMTNPDVTVEYNGEKFRYRKGMAEVIGGIAADKMMYRFDVNTDTVIGEMYVILNAHDSDDEQMYTWVNNTLLFDGGKCNTQFLNALFDRVITHLEKDAKKTKSEVTKNDVRHGLLVMANLKLKQPEYDSQSKTRLTGPDMRKDFVACIEEQWKSFSKYAEKWLLIVLERAVLRHHRTENKKAIEEHQKTMRKRVEGLLDATSKNRSACQLLITEGLCLDENTCVKVLGDAGMIDKRIGDLQVGDTVVTHTNSFKPVTNLIRTLKQSITIETKYGNVVCSKEHKWLVYDTTSNTFTWEIADNISSATHKLVRSRLGDLIGCDRFSVEPNTDDDNDMYPYVISTPSEIIKSSATHTFIVLDVDVGRTLEVQCSDLQPDTHLLLMFSFKK